MKIKYIIDVTISKPDIYGNTYSVYDFTFVETGKTVRGNQGQGSGENIRSVMFYINGSHQDNYYFTKKSVPVREFNRLEKKYPSQPNSDVAKWILSLKETGNVPDPRFE